MTGKGKQVGDDIALEPKTTRNSPVVEQVGFVFHCGGKDTHHGNLEASQ